MIFIPLSKASDCVLNITWCMFNNKSFSDHLSILIREDFIWFVNQSLFDIVK
jgi:hypothetical protein